MSQHWIEDTVIDYVSSLHQRATMYQVHDCKESESLFCCLSSPCLSAFFSTVPGDLSVETFVPRVEDEIRVWRDENKWKYLDLNLILLLEKPETNQVLSNIRRNTTLCRKFAIFSTDPSDLQKKLAFLPFSPLDTGKAPSLRVLSLSPEALLRRSGASQEFAHDLVAQRPGAKKLSGKVTEKEYALTAKTDPSVETTTHEESKQLSTLNINQYRVSLENVSLTNFRGIGRQVVFPLGSKVTVLFGINGTGKTSICDAVEWAVTGSLARVDKPDGDAKAHEAERSIVNYFAIDQGASVELTLDADSGKVKRSVNAKLKQTITTSESDNNWGAIQATTQSLRRPGLDLRRARDAFRSCHILEQSTIRDFLDRDPADRFEAISRILGYDELVRLTRKLQEVRKFVEDEAQKKKPQQSEATQRLRESKSEADAIEKSIKDRESALSSQPTTDQVFIEAATEAKACELPTPKPPEILSNKAMKQWLTDATEAIAAVNNSLKDTLKKAGEYLLLAEEVEAEKTEIQKLKTMINTCSSNEKRSREKASKLEIDLARKNAKKAEIEVKLNSKRRELETLKWASSNSGNLLIEESKIKGEQKDLIRVDEQVNDRQVELQQLQNRLNEMTTKLLAKSQEVEKAEDRRNAIEELIKLRQEWSLIISSLKKLKLDTDDISREITLQEKDVAKLRAEQKAARESYNQLRKNAEAEEAINSRRTQLLAELRQTLSPSEKNCPFCGFEYKDFPDLLKHMEKVEESPSEAYRLALSKAQQEKKRLTSLDVEFRERENLLNALVERQKENIQSTNDAKIRLFDLRDKATTLGIIPEDVDEGFVPKEALLHEALTKVSVSSLNQALKDLKLEEQNFRSKIKRIQEVIEELTAKRKAIDDSIGERNERINLIRLQASEESAVDLLALPKNEVQKSITFLKKAINKKTKSLQEAEAIIGQVVKDQSSILQKADDLKRQLDQWQLRVAEASQRKTNLKASLLSIGVEGEVTPRTLAEFQSQLEARIGRINQLRQSCSILAEMLQLDTLREELRLARQKVKQEENSLVGIEKEIRKIKKKLSNINNVSASFQKLTMIDMSETLKALSAPLNSIFERLNGHPLFGALKIDPNEKNKTVAFRIETPQNSEDSSNAEIPTDIPPRSYLSDAQLNIVALSIFLSIALYQTWSRFKLIVIDDPVQQMDDLNAASFIDLIREVSIQNHRQFVITTCNDEFYRLALSKLSCLNTRAVTRFRAYRLEGLRREGPEIIIDAPYWENEEAKAAETN